MARGSLPVLGILAASCGYALVRYVLFGGVAPAQIPAYVLNKGFALASVAALLWALRAGSADRARWLAFGVLSLLHVYLSLALMSPAYYPAFFRGGRMGLTGESALLGGALAAVAYARREPRWTTLGCAALLLHLGAQGLPGWGQPRTWPALLPPISLLGFLGGVGALILAWKAERR